MDLISLNEFLISGLKQPWTVIYTKIIAITLLYGASVHIGNIFGLTGTAWLSTPVLWRSMDILLLTFDFITAIALWQGRGWSVWLLFNGILLLQVIPYTLLRSYFIVQPEDSQVLNSLLGTEAIFLSIFILLLWWRK